MTAKRSQCLWSHTGYPLTFPFLLEFFNAYRKFWGALCSFCKKSLCHTWLQLKHDSAWIEHLQISLYWTQSQTDWFYMPFTHCSSDSDSCLCFHSVPLGLLQLPTSWLSTVSHWQIAEGSECSRMTYLQGKKTTTKCQTHSSVVKLASNQGMNTVQNLHALIQCTHRHWTTIPLWTSSSVHFL